MAAVTLRVASFDANQGGFPLEFREEGGAVTSGVLPADSLVSPSWYIPAAEGGAAPGGAADVVTTVADANASGRDLVDWPALGAFLFDCLFPIGPVRTRWQQLPARTELLLDIEPQSLARVPWELASSTAPVRQLGLTNGMSRLLERGAAASPPVSASWPFRLLVLVGCSEADEAALDVTAEVRSIERRFLPLGRSVDVRVERRPLKDDFRNLVKEWSPQVIHFAGHGEREPGGTAIGLKVEASSPWLWTPSRVQLDLVTWDWVPRFVFLNACRSATEREGAWGLQRSFVESGAAAVLAMLADVRGDRAGLLAAELYDQCARGKTIQSALRAAREGLADAPGAHLVDYSVPSLVATAPAVTLFAPLTAPADPEYQLCREFEEARFFADCREQRRLLTQWLAPPVPTDDPGPNVLVVRGPRKIGKSHLLKWCMENWALLGARVRYIEVHDGRPKDFLFLLRQIRDGEYDGNIETKFLHEGLPPGAFRRFNWELNRLLTTGQKGEWTPNEPDQGDLALPLTARGERRLEPVVCAAYLDALAQVAAGRPLVLVFDMLGGPRGERLLDPTADFLQLVLHLFRPIAQARSRSIRLVFSVSTAEYDDYQLKLLPEDRTLLCDLPHDYTNEQLLTLAAEMLWFRLDVTALAGGVLDLPSEPDGPKGLARLSDVVMVLKTRPRLAGLVGRMR